MPRVNQHVVRREDRCRTVDVTDYAEPPIRRNISGLTTTRA